MTDRDRLIELILQGENEADKKGIANCQMYNLEKAKILVEHLLANGVIVPPCKVGDKVYCIEYNLMLVEEYTVDGYTFKNGKLALYVRSGIYSTVVSEWFLTKEEAEEKLRELG